MDLGAFLQIEDLGKIAEANGIIIPRLRGYRLMKDEKPITKEELKVMKKAAAIEAVERLCRAEPFWDSRSCISGYSPWAEEMCDYYLVTETDEKGENVHVDIRWDRIHGRKREILNKEILSKEIAIQTQFNAWNRYAGREDVLYIHSRMGGGNWLSYKHKEELVDQPWFLARVDDWWDCTYCDFYAKIK